jgi:Ca-activated chloride channel family protein
MYGLLLVGLASGIIGVAGPTWKKYELPGRQLETPVVVLLDMSDSMLSDDIQPSRLERAKFKLNDFLSGDPRARVALIGYAGTAHTIVPLTHDYEIIRSHVDGLSPSVMPEPGNNFTEALQRADSVMSVTTAPGIVVVFTDDSEDVWLPDVQQYLANTEHRAMVLPFRTQINSNKASTTERLEVYQLTLDRSEVEHMAEAIRRDLVFTESPEEKEDEWRDAGWIMVLPFTLVLLLWFQRGWVLLCLLLVVSSCHQVETFQDLWYTKDYQGQRLSNRGNFEQAAGTYTDPLRQGVAYYKAGNFIEAAKAFDKDTTAIAAYNKGLAFAQLGDLRSAQAAFDQAIEMDPDLQQATENQQMISQIMQQQDEVSLEDAEEETGAAEQVENIQNQDMEDLGGGNGRGYAKTTERRDSRHRYPQRQGIG